jgi:Xaa-Pro aminopeptidase
VYVRARPVQYSSNRHVIAEAKTFVGVDIIYCKNLVDIVWGSKRPSRPKNPIFSLDVKYAGADHATKLASVRQELEKQKARALVVAMLDEVAWLFNLRGADIEFNPVFFGYAVVTTDTAILFVNPEQVSQDVRARLGQEVQLRPYDEFFTYLEELGSDLQVRSSEYCLLIARGFSATSG